MNDMNDLYDIIDSEFLGKEIVITNLNYGESSVTVIGMVYDGAEWVKIYAKAAFNSINLRKHDVESMVCDLKTALDSTANDVVNIGRTLSRVHTDMPIAQ